MKKIKFEAEADFCSLEELSEKERMIVERAIEATKNSYANYSNFHVGAAALLSDGTIVIGANQENAAFPSGLCAERTALFAAQANKPDQPVDMLAIAARNKNGLTDVPVSPCGACRQVMVGVESRYSHPMKLLLYGTKGIYRFQSVSDLMPYSFVEDSMK